MTNDIVKRSYAINFWGLTIQIAYESISQAIDYSQEVASDRGVNVALFDITDRAKPVAIKVFKPKKMPTEKKTFEQVLDEVSVSLCLACNQALDTNQADGETSTLPLCSTCRSKQQKTVQRKPKAEARKPDLG